MEELLSFSLSGVYSLLLLNLIFSFLLGIRIRQMEATFLSKESQINSLISGIDQKLSQLEDSMR